MKIFGMWTWLTKKMYVAKEIQKNTFTDSSKNTVDLFVPPREPKLKMVAMDINKQKSRYFGKKKCFFIYETQMKRVRGAYQQVSQ